MKLSSFPYRRLVIILILITVTMILVVRYVPIVKMFRVSVKQQQGVSAGISPGREVPNSLLFDCEVPPGKEIPSGVEKGIAHSGSYAMTASGKNSFTPAIERKASELGLDKMQAIAISAWVYVKPTTHSVDGVLVFSASNELGVNICWKGVGVKDPGVPRGKWFKVSSYFDLAGSKIKPDTRIQVYFWNNSNCDILVDDIYIVLGGPYQKKGDTAQVDLTRHAYERKFNFPPFPVILLERNDKQMSGIRPEDFRQGSILVAGNFSGSRQGTEQLVVFDPSGKAFIYYWCGEPGSFEKKDVDLRAVQQKITNGKVLKGKFISGKPDLLFIRTGPAAYLCQVEGIPACDAKDGGQAGLRVLWQWDTPTGIPLSEVNEILAADLDGDGLAELSVTDREGKWELFRFKAGAASNKVRMEKICSLDKGEVPEWNSGYYGYRTFAGRFAAKAQDQLLTVFTEKSSGTTSYSIRVFSAGKLKPVFPPGNGNHGLTIGLDTLKQNDDFLFVRDASGDRILRLNRDWRFDLKEISFNDSTFVIRNNVDFSGYTADHNPKYYGSLVLVPGCFIKESSGSILVVGRNLTKQQPASQKSPGLPELPDFKDIYSFRNPVSK
jgi:hypothetical protein